MKSITVYNSSLTKRAPDAGDSAAISNSFFALSFFWLDGFAVPHPSAGNACRWAASTKYSESIAMPRKISLKEMLTVQIKKAGAVLLGTLLLTTVMTGICYLLVQIIPQDVLYEISHGHRSGENLFRVFLINPIPKSVAILESQDDGGFGDYIFLHFKISPEDFNDILISEKYEITTFVPANGYYNDTDFPTGLNWWNIKSLGKNAAQYSVDIKYETPEGYRHERVQTIWVNLQKNEVYFKVFFIN